MILSLPLRGFAFSSLAQVDAERTQVYEGTQVAVICLLFRV